ncbi:hypothetical protein, partial [Corallococcus praedator]|uniref:hypothetical protein n=1 Tax=Corallococcus praedator TaxID=2316724 RepID=UPI001ABEF506
SQEYASKSRIVWSAFQCSYYAEVMGNVQEQERLFTLGYQAGGDFLADLETAQIEEGDLCVPSRMIT